ncbi:hypothetical protein Metev_0026 [Methanohalobium evestigatum Z-7303]|uniref:Uncharacterized protein n=1 Tax=Methanohalobium evestigatum (strain ATCC BAA-1072 / DSM 3721 / NBRC 107634 / OCM 161 / Z-7303) TaxID=644295 RepID=D7E5T6_METEZ|nr:hypothetical protein [Methanohalobium evestigatum]ADI72958.1 hypothetical protein Metev_0026 [Methanohalobium evestigatum Z-7303]
MSKVKINTSIPQEYKEMIEQSGYSQTYCVTEALRQFFYGSDGKNQETSSDEEKNSDVDVLVYEERIQELKQDKERLYKLLGNKDLQLQNKDNQLTEKDNQLKNKEYQISSMFHKINTVEQKQNNKPHLTDHLKTDDGNPGLLKRLKSKFTNN